MLFDKFSIDAIIYIETCSLTYMKKIKSAAIALAVVMGILYGASIVFKQQQITEKFVAWQIENGAGTAGDPSLQQSVDITSPSPLCVVTHIMGDKSRPGKMIAFLQDTSTGKYICYQGNTPVGAVPCVRIVDDNFVGPLNLSGRPVYIPDGTWTQCWITNPKYPGLWVIGLKEE
jgi:hypothetical protein